LKFGDLLLEWVFILADAKPPPVQAVMLAPLTLSSNPKVLISYTPSPPTDVFLDTKT